MKPKIPRRIDFSFFFCCDYYCVTEVKFGQGTEHEKRKKDAKWKNDGRLQENHQL